MLLRQTEVLTGQKEGQQGHERFSGQQDVLQDFSFLMFSHAKSSLKSLVVIFRD